MTASPALPSDPNLLRQRQLDQVCDRFERAWKAAGTTAEPPRIEDFLSDTLEPERQALLRELVSLEVYYRRRCGEAPPTEEYRRRFPSLDPAWLAATIAAARADQIVRAGHAETAVAAGSGLNERPGEPPATVRCFGDYELLSEIARGGMGVVYRARQRSLQRIVALKMIRAGELASEDEIQRFHTEAEAAANLDHPGIVPIHEVGQHAGQHYFSMGYVEGESLAARVAQGPMPPSAAAELVREVARAVQYAHDQGVIHRDLKPANILLDRTGRPRVTDFGLAKRVAADSSLTVSGQVLGTPSYMPPEQAAGHADQIGPAADVYALGAVLYALLTGRPPFQAATPTETLRQVLEQDPVPLRQLNPAAPRDLETMALKCLAKDFARRYASAAAFADDLDRWLANKPIVARPAGRWERAVKWARRRPAVAGSIGTVLIITLVAFGLVTSFWLDAKRLAVRLALDRGRTLCEQGHVGRGLLWMAYTLRMVSPGDTKFALAVRANLAAWGSQLSPLRCLLPHPGPVQSATFSPDGQRVLTVSADHTVRLWDVKKAEKGELSGQLLEPSGPVLVALFSPQSECILTGTQDGECCLWEAATGARVARWRHDAAVQAAAFRPRDGSTAVTGDRNGRVRLSKTANGELVREATAEGSVQAVAFSPDGETLVTGSAKGQVALWKADTLAPIGTLRWPPNAPGGEVWFVQFSPGGGAFLLAATKDDQAGTSVVHLWNVGQRKYLATLEHRWQIDAVDFSPDGTRVLTGGGDYTARLWEAETGRRLDPPLLHQDDVAAVAFSPQGRILLTGSHDCTARLWNADTGEPIGPLLEHPAPLGAVAFSPDGRTFATVGREPTVRLWRTGPEQHPTRHDSEVMAVAISAERHTLAVGTKDGLVREYELATDQKPACLGGHGGEVWALAYSPGGTHLLSAGRDGTVRVWDPDNPQTPLAVLHDKFRVRSMAVSPDGKKFLTGSGSATMGAACLWDMPTGPTVQELPQDGAVWAVAFGRNQEGQIFAIASGEDTLQIWKKVQDWSALPPPTELRPLHQSRVVALAFCPDGQFLASGSTDKTAQLWRTSDGKPVGKPLRHSSAVWAAAFSANNRILITGCRDGSVNLWDVATGTSIGPAWQHRGPAWSVVCDPDPDGQYVWSGGDDKTVRQWRLPGVVADDRDRISLWVPVLTGMEFDQNQVAHWLDASAWQQRCRRLQQLGGPPLP